MEIPNCALKATSPETKLKLAHGSAHDPHCRLDLRLLLRMGRRPQPRMGARQVRLVRWWLAVAHKPQPLMKRMMNMYTLVDREPLRQWRNWIREKKRENERYSVMCLFLKSEEGGVKGGD